MEKGKLIGQGRTAEIFQWEQDKILKLFRLGLPKFMIEREYEVSSHICKHLSLVPKVYELIEIDNRSGIIYERINGITMMEVLVSEPLEANKEAQRLAELHKSIQQKVDYQLPNCKTRLKDNISNTELLQHEVKIKLYEYIDKLEEDNVLCHGDFHPDNILITKDKAIIIDWMTATKGNPLMDIARTSVIFKFGVAPDKMYTGIQNEFYLEYIKHYMNITGTKIEQIEEWELPVAAARLIEWLPENEKVALLKFVDMKMENIK